MPASKPSTPSKRPASPGKAAGPKAASGKVTGSTAAGSKVPGSKAAGTKAAGPKAPGSTAPGSKAATPAERRAKAQAFRQAQIAKERRTRRLIVALVVVVVAGLVTGGIVLATHKSSTSSASGQVVPAFVTSGTRVTQKAAVPIADDSGIDGVLAWNTSGYPGTSGDPATAIEHDHVTGPVTYSVTPPVGGPHNAIWMNAGVYTKPVPTERGVHDMEHGAVWITYSPSLPAADVATLTAFVGKQSMIAEAGSAVTGQQNRYMEMSPWADDTLPSPIVLSSWGHQLRVTSASDPRLQKFVDTFRHNQKYSPEFGAAVDGVPVDTGGVPASFGPLKADPAGSA